MASYRQLEPAEILQIVRTLRKRVEARFPGSGLGKVIEELGEISEQSIDRNRWIQRPHLGLRVTGGVLALGIVAVLIGLLLQIRQFQFSDYAGSIQALDSSISSIVFIGAAILFLVSWENRIKRKRALQALHELRAMAHIIDMHQLTKDPEVCCANNPFPTGQLARRQMTPFEMNRYLDYCTEGLALISKIAALYAQNFPDTALLNAVDDIEDLTNGLSRKIWQKLTILESLSRTLPSSGSPTRE